MNYSIICDARKGNNLGINKLALVDRSKTKKIWWTSDSSSLIMKFRLRSAAEYSLKRLFRNNPRIVEHDAAVRIINEQENDIEHNEAENEAGFDYLCECGSKE